MNFCGSDVSNVVKRIVVTEQGPCIATLQRDLTIAYRIINELKIEKDEIVAEKNKEIEHLKNQIKSPKKVVIATENNVVHLFNTSDKRENKALSSKEKCSGQNFDSSKTNVIKKKTKKAKNIDVSSIQYNLRSRDIVKSYKKSENKYV